MKPLNVSDFRQHAMRRLPRFLFEYIDRGTEDEVGLRRLRTTLDDVKLKPTVLNDVSSPDLTVCVLGDRLEMPVVCSPTAVAGLVCYDGEVQVARAARSMGIPFCVATQSITTMEEIAERAPGANLWFQLYVFDDRTLSDDLLKRARALGIKNLLVTVDTPRSPKKEWNARNGFSIPLKPSVRLVQDLLLHPRWSIAVMLRYMAKSGMPAYGHYDPRYKTAITRASTAKNVSLARNLTWDDLRAIRKLWDGRLVVKGIMAREDAEKAVCAGADGVVVSSHGGRNIDCSPTAIEALPRIADAVGSRTTVLADSGVRRGSDILKFLASGAQAVLVGRAPLYGAAVSGEKGAEDVLKILREELDSCMAFAGVGRAAAVDRRQLWAA